MRIPMILDVIISMPPRPFSREALRLGFSARHLPAVDDLAIPGAAPLSGFRPNEVVGKGVVNYAVVIAVCVVAFVVAKLFLCSLLLWRWFYRHKVYEVKLSGGKLVMFKSYGKSTPSPRYVAKRIQNLSANDVIGSGGQGIVYRLVIDESTALAVKKMQGGLSYGESSFDKELKALGDLRHRNIVALRGYYSDTNVGLLIYDLLSNGSLKRVLHDRPNGQLLDWYSRLKIALGTARGLAYLHWDCVPHILHRDIKSSNILLDANMEPHVSDFGLANLLECSKSHVFTRIAGTFGYLAPEYLDSGKATKQGDVFSFGVVLLELVTGKPATDQELVEQGINLVYWAKLLMERGHEQALLDNEVKEGCSERSMTEALHIACQCVNVNPQHRPTMPQVVKMLEIIASDDQ